MRYDYYKITRERVDAVLKRLTHKDIEKYRFMTPSYDLYDCIMEEMINDGSPYEQFPNDLDHLREMIAENFCLCLKAYECVDGGSTSFMWDIENKDYFRADFTIRKMLTEDIVEQYVKRDDERIAHLKIQVTTCYCEKSDITFIMETGADYVECIGWYYGKPDDVSTEQFSNSLRQEF